MKDALFQIAVLTLKIALATLDILDPRVHATSKQQLQAIKALADELNREAQSLPT